MFKLKRVKITSGTSNRRLALRAVFAAICVAAFAIYGWGIEYGAFVELILFLFLLVLAMIVPAAVFVGLLKLVSRSLKRSKREEEL